MPGLARDPGAVLTVVTLRRRQDRHARPRSAVAPRLARWRNLAGSARRAVAEFDARVGQIGDHQWQAPIPDEDWSVRDLVNHLVGEDLWVPLLLAGSTIAEVGDCFEGDVLGAEPRAAWTAASAAAVQAVEADGAMDRIVHLSFGASPAASTRYNCSPIT